MNNKRKPLDDALEKRFVFGDSSPTAEVEPPKAENPVSSKPSMSNPWESIEVTQKSATVRLNVDIPVELNDLLAEKARQLRKPKTELVRRLLEWALNDSDK